MHETTPPKRTSHYYKCNIKNQARQEEKHLSLHPKRVPLNGTLSLQTISSGYKMTVAHRNDR
jgi:hypothetical protein